LTHTSFFALAFHNKFDYSVDNVRVNSTDDSSIVCEIC